MPACKLSSPWLHASLLCLSSFIVGCSPSSPENAAAAPGQSGGPQAALCKHEVTEKYCPICRPEVRKDPNILICKEHFDIPEEICTACHPELKTKLKTCEHELPPALCGHCQAKAKQGGADGSK